MVTLNPSLEKNYLRKVRSFVKREGRISIAHQEALDKSWPQYGLTVSNGPLNLAEVFGRHAPCILEIGFGNGHSLLTLAAQYPQYNFLGIEVHSPGVGALLHRANQSNLTNIRVYSEDAVSVLKECISDQSLSGLLLFFPDPWPKQRHHKRRLVQPAFVELVAKKLQNDACWHLATDWQDYAKQMQTVLQASSLFTDKNVQTLIEQRPETKYEQRGRGLGYGVWDFVFRKI